MAQDGAPAPYIYNAQGQEVEEITDSPYRPDTPADTDDEGMTIGEIRQRELEGSDLELAEQLEASGAYTMAGAMDAVEVAATMNVEQAPLVGWDLDLAKELLEPAKPTLAGGYCVLCQTDGAVMVAVHQDAACLCCCRRCYLEHINGKVVPCLFCKREPITWLPVHAEPR